MDDAKQLAVLHSLYSITFTAPGRDAVVTVFALDDNISVLLPFIEMNGVCHGTFLFIIKSYTEYSKAKAKSKKPNYYIVAK